MKLFTKLLLIMLVLGNTNSYSQQCQRFPYPYSITMPSCNNGTYTLKFEDNFNGNQLDLSVWGLPLFGLGSKVGDNSHQLYTFDSENLEVSNGTLKIMAVDQPKTGLVVGYCPPQCQPCATQQEIDDCIMSDGFKNLRTFNRSSSNIWTIKNDFLEGKYEIRCRISKGKGLWPAFWTFSGDSEPGGTIWSEHDFFEIYHDDDNFRYTNNVHFDLNNDGETNGEQCDYEIGHSAANDFENWHTYTTYFEKDKIEYFIDGNFIHRKTRYLTLSGQSLFCDDGTIGAGSAYDLTAWPRQPMQLVLNMAIETGSNAPNASTVFPATYEIDYVRYWGKVPICDNDVVKFTTFSGVHKGNVAVLFYNAKVITATSATVIARNEIIILPDFHVEEGASFYAIIDPLVCNSNARIIDTTINEHNRDVFQDNLKMKEELLSTDNIVSQIKIYPNPTTGIFTIELENLINNSLLVEVYDIMGKKVVNKTVLENKMVINIANFPKGIYLVRVINNNKTFTQKIVYQ